MVIGICDDNREDAIRIQQEVCKCLKLFGEEKNNHNDFRRRQKAAGKL